MTDTTPTLDSTVREIRDYASANGHTLPTRGRKVEILAALQTAIAAAADATDTDPDASPLWTAIAAEGKAAIVQGGARSLLASDDGEPAIAALVDYLSDRGVTGRLAKGKTGRPIGCARLAVVALLAEAVVAHPATRDHGVAVDGATIARFADGDGDPDGWIVGAAHQTTGETPIVLADTSEAVVPASAVSAVKAAGIDLAPIDPTDDKGKRRVTATLYAAIRPATDKTPCKVVVFRGYPVSGLIRGASEAQHGSHYPRGMDEDYAIALRHDLVGRDWGTIKRRIADAAVYHTAHNDAEIVAVLGSAVKTAGLSADKDARQRAIAGRFTSTAEAVAKHASAGATILRKRSERASVKK